MMRVFTFGGMGAAGAIVMASLGDHNLLAAGFGLMGFFFLATSLVSP